MKNLLPIGTYRRTPPRISCRTVHKLKRLGGSPQTSRTCSPVAAGPGERLRQQESVLLPWCVSRASQKSPEPDSSRSSWAHHLCTLQSGPRWSNSSRTGERLSLLRPSVPILTLPSLRFHGHGLMTGPASFSGHQKNRDDQDQLHQPNRRIPGILTRSTYPVRPTAAHFIRFCTSDNWACAASQSPSVIGRLLFLVL